MPTYGALIDSPKAFEKGSGLRFNAYFWCEHDGSTILNLYLKGMRISNGLIHLPAYSAKVLFPNVYLPKPWAEALIEDVNGGVLREEFPKEFPLLTKELLLKGLTYDMMYVKRDFPRLAQEMGLLE